MNKLLLTVLLTLTFMSFSLHADPQRDIDESTVILTGKVHESCVELKLGESVEYTFESDAMLSYNVHYHDGEEIVFPVTEHKANNESNVFTAEADQVYCLMWTNSSDGQVTVRYTYKLRDPAE